MDGKTKYLVHHGILGQKWGVRNSDTYPLSYNEHSATQRRLNPKSALDNYGGHSNSTSSNKNANRSGTSRTSRSTSDKKSSSSIGDLFKNVTSSIGFDKRKEYQDAVEEQYIHENPLTTDYGDMAQEKLDELMEKYNKLGTYKMTDEDYADFKWYTALVEDKKKRNQERQEKVDGLLDEYKSTPLGTIETAYNDAINAGKSTVDSIVSGVSDAASDVSDFFKNLFG